MDSSPLPGEKYDKEVKLVLVGDSGVGKTSILLKYFDDKFNANSNTTIGIDYKSKIVIKNGQRINLRVWDTAGQEKFHSNLSAYIKGAQGIFVVYSCTDAKSFERLDAWMETINQSSSADVPRIMLGNQCDLVARKTIDSRSGGEKASRFNVQFFETSAIEGKNIRAAFDSMLQKVDVAQAKTAFPPVQAQAQNKKGSCC